MGKKARVVPQRPPTKRQLSRWERERRTQRIIMAGGLFAILLVVTIPLFGFYREFVARAQEPIARVNQEAFRLGEYAEVLRLRRYLLDAQIGNLRQVTGQAGEQLQSSLQSSELARAGLPNRVVEDWIEEQLVRQEAARVGLAVTPQEVTEAIRPEFDPLPTGEGQIEPLSEQGFQKRYQDFLGRARTTDARYRSLREWILLSGKLEGRLQGQVQSPSPQVHLQAILVATEDEARNVLARLEKDEDWAQVAQEVSQDQASKGQGGDLGWMPRGLRDRALEAAAFSLPPGQVSRPISTPEGYYILRVLERDEAREVEPVTLEEVKAMAFDRWLEEAQAQNRVERYVDSDKVEWALARIGGG